MWFQHHFRPRSHFDTGGSRSRACTYHFKKNLATMHHYYRGVIPGVPGVSWHPQILADQLHNPISIKGGRLCPPYNTPPDFQTFLRHCWLEMTTYPVRLDFSVALWYIQDGNFELWNFNCNANLENLSELRCHLLKDIYCVEGQSFRRAHVSMCASATKRNQLALA
jgi:hypothetical protein